MKQREEKNLSIKETLNKTFLSDTFQQLVNWSKSNKKSKEKMYQGRRLLNWNKEIWNEFYDKTMQVIHSQKISHDLLRWCAKYVKKMSWGDQKNWAIKLLYKINKM